MFNPTKIIAIGLNYHDHAKEMNVSVPEYPLIFMKPPTTVILNGESIIYPHQTKELHYEGELGIVIKEKIKDISKDEAYKFIAGYTCANDVTARDLQRIDGQWTRSKSFDTFCPLGPRIVSHVDPIAGLEIITRVNGNIKQYSNTKNMIFNVYELVSFISHIMTLMPGDVIITGTPPGVGPLVVGDTVEVEIEGIGVLKNMVTAR
ncbi:MAG TPA: fumarylacetoacetate hydrolase family protein [Syntrophorhabdaceae bacterium]|nr:fumarylacetoacetate hydrolase family protein [Syntrophorhabdaceae bacterium]HOL05040.1 fumarylacetoacetate hydrolase family protein [Syntrophorhabdaceae bacterium]HON85380.1 fumarylacetoacetate hydrolase family protein [Syntrophorhabdaceae bacterium]HOT41614.1 fumarylacetoacetate hydrolase family protein [Syntrophorhabdaceae bacterium]HPC66961.1 fumarylacetoacetate hydrolase family protein [Syntrophorhabdaceae bacterium]